MRLPLFRCDYHYFNEITKTWYPVLKLMFKSSVNVTHKNARRRSFNPKRRLIFCVVFSCAADFKCLNCNFAFNKKMYFFCQLSILFHLVNTKSIYFHSWLCHLRKYCFWCSLGEIKLVNQQKWTIILYINTYYITTPSVIYFIWMVCLQDLYLNNFGSYIW